jgi:hypothetical protein
MHSDGESYIYLTPRCEADMYGYSAWLARHLHYEGVPMSMRRFQHGWFWYDYDEGKDYTNFFYEMERGSLVQDQSYANGLRQDGLMAFSTGLPFTNFFQIEKRLGNFQHTRQGTLFVPYRSYGTSDNSDYIMEQIKDFASCCEDFSVMLSFDDAKYMELAMHYASKVVIGASATELNSLYRVATIFSSYERMFTTYMGSHILYGLICGMPVGIYKLASLKLRGTDQIMVEQGKWKDAFTSKFHSREYLDSKFPGLVSDDFKAEFRSIPAVPETDPAVISALLGW